MRRTTCCEFLGCFLRGMRDGSKSGGKYLLRTMLNEVSEYHLRENSVYLPLRSDISLISVSPEDVESGRVPLSHRESERRKS